MWCFLSMSSFLLTCFFPFQQLPMLAYHLFSFLYMYVACIFTFWFFNRIFSVFAYSGTNHLNYCNCITLPWNFSVRKFREATWDLLRLYFKSLKYHPQLNYSEYLGCINPLHWALKQKWRPLSFHFSSLCICETRVSFPGPAKGCF